MTVEISTQPQSLSHPVITVISADADSGKRHVRYCIAEMDRSAYPSATLSSVAGIDVLLQCLGQMREALLADLRQ